MQLLRQLRALGKATQNQLPNLNYGGCAVYAARVGQRLAELGIDVWCIYTESWWSSSYSHVLLQFKYNGRTYIHDSASTKQRFEDGEYKTMTLKKCISEARRTDIWNSEFSRRSGIPVIRKNIEQYLSDEALG